jgi:hypothetical protein
MAGGAGFVAAFDAHRVVSDVIGEPREIKRLRVEQTTRRVSP